MTWLLMAILLGAGPLAGTVDRVEGGWAVVEWPGNGFFEVPATLFTRPPREGRHVRLWVLPHPRGPWRLEAGLLLHGTGEPPFDFQLPAPAGVRADRRYRVVLTVIGPEASSALADGAAWTLRPTGGLQPTPQRKTP